MKRDSAPATIKIGILSDTHLTCLSKGFQEKITECFAGVSMVLHAGDLTTAAVLSAFGEMRIHAVHGNMCDYSTRALLPEKKIITVGAHTLGLIHKPGGYNGYDFEDLLLSEFDEVSCIVFGHTHLPACRKVGGVLLINPGSFMATGRYGARGTYVILEVGEHLRASIFEVPDCR